MGKKQKQTSAPVCGLVIHIIGLEKSGVYSNLFTHNSGRQNGYTRIGHSKGAVKKRGNRKYYSTFVRGVQAVFSQVQTLDRTLQTRMEKEDKALEEIGKKACLGKVSLSFRSTNKPE